MAVLVVVVVAVVVVVDILVIICGNHNHDSGHFISAPFLLSSSLDPASEVGTP